MLQSINKLYGKKLGAQDGEIGHVKDFYFSDQSWVIRYVIIDTGNWLMGRKVLLSPHALGGFCQDGKVLLANLTRKQIENSPLIETHKPVSRQYEEEYYQYFGWPCYWQGDGLWGMSGFPILESPPRPLPGTTAAATDPKREPADAHLRSTQAVKGYHLQASDGIIGHVSDFMMDEESWSINELVVKIGHRFTGKEVLISRSNVSRISYEESTVFVYPAKETVEQSPEHHLSAAGVADAEHVNL
jgi:sporulation protein YlmC with PRC-barrel domain